jgi:hypothetical protein
LRDIVFFEEPRRVFIVWADDDRLQCFVAKLKAAGQVSLVPIAFGEPRQTVEAAYFVECPSISIERAQAFIDDFLGPDQCC